MAITLFARGAWKVKNPFVVAATTVYTCIANRSFREIEAEGMGVYELVYQPAGLTQEQCETDRVAAVSIITLESDGNPNIMIPTSYILDYPNAVAEGFSRVVLAVEIGVLSDKVPLEFLKENLKQAVQDVVGVEDAEVKLFVAPYQGVITPDQAELMESNRLQLIKTGVNQYSENKRLQEELAIERAKRLRLEEIIIANSIEV